MVDENVLQDAVTNKLVPPAPLSPPSPDSRVNSDGVVIESKPASRMSKLIDNFKTTGELGDVEVSPPASTVDDSSSVPAPVADPVRKQGDQAQNFKALRTALDHANSQIEEFKTKVDKRKDYDDWKTKAEVLEKEITEIKPRYEELNEWKNRYGLVSEKEFAEKIAEPRQQIAATIKSELASEGIDEEVWDLVQQVNTRKELEDIVNNNIESSLLKQQFYNLYFQDLELRKQEAAALKAPKEYLARVRQEENDKRNFQKVELDRSYAEVVSVAAKDANEMALKMGDNKILEIVEIKDNAEHNENTVKPLLTVADRAANAELEERRLHGLPINRQIAANIIYKYRQAVATQAVNQDRIRWFTEYSNVKKELDTFKAKYDKLMSNASPTPGVTNGSSNGTGKVVAEGNTPSERFSNLVNSFKEGKL